jgi:hypothetical protein
VGIVGLLDDPVHPVDVARRWRALLPRAALVTTTLATMGRDPEALGRAATLAWARALHSGPRRVARAGSLPLTARPPASAGR